MPKKLVVTGGLGFIGSNFIEKALERGYSVINIDKQTYAARTDLDFDRYPNYQFIKEDICTLNELPEADYVVNFAAESHVDNSILSHKHFFDTNTYGVYNLLELVRAYPSSNRPVFVQISTDEVYGPISEGSFSESDRLHPSNPYSASKAAADQMVLAWGRTYDIPYRICRSSNNYGYGQYPEKLFAKAFEHVLMSGKKVPLYGNGKFTREWTYVCDNCEAILTIIEKCKDNEIYNISAKEELSAFEVVSKIIEAMGKKPEEWMEFVEDRPGHDERYSVDTDKIESLGWKPEMTLENYIPMYLELLEKRKKV